jgi:hypothetical protein
VKIEARMELECGHVLQFKANGAPGSGPELAHQKDEIVRESWNRFLEQIFLAPMRVLEIGVCRGGSLALWAHLWHPSEIVGIDNDLGQVTEVCKAHYYCCHTTFRLIGMTMPDPGVRDLGCFDLIIDDGGHGPKAVFPALDRCWEMLNPGGFYVVEDWHHDFLQPQELRSHIEGYALDGRAKRAIVYPAILVLEKP